MKAGSGKVGTLHVRAFAIGQNHKRSVVLFVDESGPFNGLLNERQEGLIQNTLLKEMEGLLLKSGYYWMSCQSVIVSPQPIVCKNGIYRNVIIQFLDGSLSKDKKAARLRGDLDTVWKIGFKIQEVEEHIKNCQLCFQKEKIWKLPILKFKAPVFTSTMFSPDNRIDLSFWPLFRASAPPPLKPPD